MEQNRINVQKIYDKLKYLLQAKSHKEALYMLDNLPVEISKETTIKFMYGQVLYIIGDYNGAKNVLFKILEDENSVRCIVLLSQTLLKLGRHGAAIACISKAIWLEPEVIQHLQIKNQLYELQLKANNRNFIIKNNNNMEVAHQIKQKSVYLLCAGEASRWKSHLGIKYKHLIPVEGQVLLDRTLNQINKYKTSNITVLVRPDSKNCFDDVCSGRAFIKEIDVPLVGETPAWKYLSSKKFVKNQGIVISLLGDVWFSDEAMERIFKDDESDWLAFGRSTSSQLTGCTYGEIFAHKFSNYNKHFDSLELLNQLYLSEMCTAHASGWALSQMISNEDPNINTVGKNFVEINDFTEDFDYPDDYERWVSNRLKLNQGSII